MPFCTAKARRTRREKAMSKMKEQIEQIAEQGVEATLKVHRALGQSLLASG